jgi:hypothetical protein
MRSSRHKNDNVAPFALTNQAPTKSASNHILPINIYGYWLWQFGRPVWATTLSEMPMSTRLGILSLIC